MKKKSKNKIPDKSLFKKYKLFSELMENTTDVIYFKDVKGKLVLVNQAHAKGLGLKPEQVIGKTDFDFFPKKRAELMVKDDMRVIKTGKPIIDKLERATRPDGEDNYVSTTKIPRYDEKGNVIGLIGITRDISSRKYTEIVKQENIKVERKLEALKELSNLKSEFISVVSHELRTPLAIIKEAVSLVYDEIAGSINEKQKEMLGRAANNVKRLNRMVEELLDISRIERGTLKLHYSLINFNDLLNDSSDFFKKLAGEKGIDMEYIIPDREVNIFIDIDRVNQVISNLISNAIKFTEENGSIKIEVRILENKIRVGVIDTGMGIRKDNISRLFDKFVQVSGTKESEKKGVGLGLSISKELIEKHGGEIWAESKLGVGSKFYFTLPRFYTSKPLSKDVRDDINSILKNKKDVYLMNLTIVNFKEFKKKTNVKPKKLFNDLTVIVDSKIKEFRDKKNKDARIAVSDYGKGEWSILFPEARDAVVKKISESIREELMDYLKDNKIKNVFINLGIMTYSKKSKGDKNALSAVNISNIYIGLEIRRFKRVGYKNVIELTLDGDKKEFSRGVDISEGGICFVTERKFNTDDSMSVKFSFPEGSKFEARARVAWKREIAEKYKKNYVHKYKVGLEFINLNKKDKKRLSESIKASDSKA